VPRKPWLIVAAMAGAVIVSWLGAVLADRPGLDAAAAPLAQRIGLMLAFGACGALAAWAYLRAAAAAVEPTALLAGAIAIHVVAALALPLTSNDLFSNLAYGRLAHDGINPYLAGPAALPAGDPFAVLVGARWQTMPIVYGPIATMVDALVVGGLTVWQALVVFKLVMVASSLGVVAIAWRVCRDRPLLFIAVAWNPLLAWEVSAQAHNDGLLVLVLTAGVWAGVARRDGVAAILLAVAVLAKLAAAPILALHMWSLLRRSPRHAILATIAVVALTVASFAVYWSGLETLRGPVLAAGGEAGRTARSFVDLATILAGPLGADTIVYRTLWTLGVAAVIATFARAVYRTRTFDDAMHESVVVLLVWNLVTPWFQPWYAVWLLPLVMIERDRRIIRLVAVYTALLVIQYALPIDPITNVAIDVWVLVEANRIRRHRFAAAPSAPLLC
jgi:alpha-1,6-mannosyltransferase